MKKVKFILPVIAAVFAVIAAFASNSITTVFYTDIVNNVETCKSCLLDEDPTVYTCSTVPTAAQIKCECISPVTDAYSAIDCELPLYKHFITE